MGLFGRFCDRTVLRQAVASDQCFALGDFLRNPIHIRRGFALKSARNLDSGRGLYIARNAVLHVEVGL